MSLAGRLLVFFLSSLAVVLLGFSTTVYVLSWSYLHRGLDAKLEKALVALEAAVHVEPDAMEWKPSERRLSIGLDAGPDHVRWSIQEKTGLFLDRSANWSAGPSPPVPSPRTSAETKDDSTILSEAPGWRIGRRHLRLGDLLRLGRTSDQIDALEEDEYDELILTAALSPEPVDASLTRLAISLAAASASTWVLCAALGRWICRQALAPIAKLAASAREKAMVDDQSNLPTPETGDELEDLGRAFNALLDRRREALERQSRFTGDASHQLRTPIAGVLSLVEVVRRRPRPAEEYELTLDQVHREARRLNRIVESLLFLARAESESEPLREEEIDLTIWAPELLQRWEGRRRFQDLQFVGDSDAIWVRAHPPLLAQAVENLVDNALKYSEAGTQVSVLVHREAHQAVIAVEDQGCGLTAAERDAVFEPFYQAPRTRLLGRGGVGLGLSVVQRIVRASRGSIGVDAVPEGGTCFTIRLPEIQNHRPEHTLSCTE